MTEKLDRKEIRERNLYPEDKWVKVRYTNHAIDQFNERKEGQFYVLPSSLNITKKIVSSIYLEDGKVKKYKIRLHYGDRKWLYMIIVDGCVCKTLWWNNK